MAGMREKKRKLKPSSFEVRRGVPLERGKPSAFAKTAELTPDQIVKQIAEKRTNSVAQAKTKAETKAETKTESNVGAPSQPEDTPVRAVDKNVVSLREKGGGIYHGRQNIEDAEGRPQASVPYFTNRATGQALDQGRGIRDGVGSVPSPVQSRRDPEEQLAALRRIRGTTGPKTDHQAYAPWQTAKQAPSRWRQELEARNQRVHNNAIQPVAGARGITKAQRSAITAADRTEAGREKTALEHGRGIRGQDMRMEQARMTQQTAREKTAAEANAAGQMDVGDRIKLAQLGESVKERQFREGRAIEDDKRAAFQAHSEDIANMQMDKDGNPDTRFGERMSNAWSPALTSKNSDDAAAAKHAIGIFGSLSKSFQDAPWYTALGFGENAPLGKGSMQQMVGAVDKISQALLKAEGKAPVTFDLQGESVSTDDFKPEDIEAIKALQSSGNLDRLKNVSKKKRR